jgi:hypothetical protein
VLAVGPRSVAAARLELCSEPTLEKIGSLLGRAKIVLL